MRTDPLNILADYYCGDRDTIPTRVYLHVYIMVVWAFVTGFTLILICAVWGRRITNSRFIHDFVELALYSNFGCDGEQINKIMNWKRERR